MCRTPCKYPGKNIAFHVNEGSTDYWLSLLVEFEDGDGDIGAMQIKEVRRTPFTHVKHNIPLVKLQYFKM